MKVKPKFIGIFIFLSGTLLLFQNCGSGFENKVQTSRSLAGIDLEAESESSNQTHDDLDHDKSNDEYNSVATRPPSLVSPVSEQRLSRKTLQIKWEDGGNSKIRVGVDVSRNPFSKDSYRKGDIARVGTTDKRDFSVDIPNDGKKYYLRFLWTLDKGDWGEPGSHVSEKRFIDRTFYSNLVENETFEASSKKAYEQAKAGLDKVLSLESSWFTSRVLKLRGQAVTEAYYHRILAFRGLVMAYEISGQQSYLQKAVDMAMYYVNAGKDLDGDGYWDWKWGHKTKPDLINHDHYEWRSAAGVALVAAALHDSGAKVTPSNALSKMTQMLEKHMWDK